jgi:hypothetical protein
MVVYLRIPISQDIPIKEDGQIPKFRRKIALFQFVHGTFIRWVREGMILSVDHDDDFIFRSREQRELHDERPDVVEVMFRILLAQPTAQDDCRSGLVPRTTAISLGVGGDGVVVIEMETPELFVVMPAILVALRIPR